MPLKTHRVNMIHVYEEAFKREDAQKWLIEFIRYYTQRDRVSWRVWGKLLGGSNYLYEYWVLLQKINIRPINLTVFSGIVSC